MRCHICGRDLDETSEVESIPIAPSAHVEEFEGLPVCDSDRCELEAREEVQEGDWRGIRIYES